MNARANEQERVAVAARPLSLSPGIGRILQTFDRWGLSTLAIGGAAWCSIAVVAWVLTNLLYL